MHHMTIFFSLWIMTQTPSIWESGLQRPQRHTPFLIKSWFLPPPVNFKTVLFSLCNAVQWSGGILWGSVFYLYFVKKILNNLRRTFYANGNFISVQVKFMTLTAFSTFQTVRYYSSTE